VDTKNASIFPKKVKPNDRFAQIMLNAVIPSKLKVVDELSETKRGEGGFGSTGK